METVKVDIQKLQLLNDRIAQTLEALNQVRMSAHGIPQTIPQTPIQVSPYGFAGYFGQPYPQVGYGTMGYPQAFAPTFVPQQFGQSAYVAPYAAGLQHTMAVPPQFAGWQQSPIASWQQSPIASWQQSPIASWSVPWAQGLQHTNWNQNWTTPSWTNQSWTNQNWTTPWTTGLSHTTWDPSWQGRGQILPFVQVW